MAIWSEFRMGQYRANYYREDAPDFTIKIGQFFIPSINRIEAEVGYRL